MKHPRLMLSTIKEISEYIENDQKISAIKALKDATSWDLRTTKDYIDQYCYVHNDGRITRDHKGFFNQHYPSRLDKHIDKAPRKPKPMTLDKLYDKLNKLLDKHFNDDRDIYKRLELKRVRNGKASLTLSISID